MWLQTPRRLFIDRKDAGEKLASKLAHYRDSGAILMAIPRGGLEIAAPLSRELSLPLDVIVVRKIPIPWNPEMAMGAMTADGSMILDDALVDELRIAPVQLEMMGKAVRQEIERRRLKYRGDSPSPQIEGSTVILVDDGLATGYTMLAAIKSAKSQKAGKIVVAVPVASVNAAFRIESEVNEFITLAIADMPAFAVADYYRYWTDLTDAEVVSILQSHLSIKKETTSA